MRRDDGGQTLPLMVQIRDEYDGLKRFKLGISPAEQNEQVEAEKGNKSYTARLIKDIVSKPERQAPTANPPIVLLSCVRIHLQHQIRKPQQGFINQATKSSQYLILTQNLSY